MAVTPCMDRTEGTFCRVGLATLANGGAGDDQLTGGTENDSLTGGEGSDTYFYYLGDGSDTINNFDRSAGRFDVLVLGEGITPSGVTVRRLGDSLIINVTGNSDQITVSNYFASFEFRVDAGQDSALLI